MMDRFTNRDAKKSIDDNLENDNINIKPNFDGVYYIQIEDSHIVGKNDMINNEKIEELALKASKKKYESGIIQNYIYKVRRNKSNLVNVMLMENEEAISVIDDEHPQ